ncbi:LysR family transcriptional regulator [Neoroseomonas soli]|uniref:LysR family transcriptional regulator n=1 Tax=Neoroseomonas soli TaxID=1081025 RepID=A0A9X9WR41_9PROT|nr:LysR family transcriptional regulator [Neoroseomonas soli]MBR0669620.1 LysR family transcriptional regulator [Neoroseomonas soli]
MKLSQIEYFVVLAEELHFGRAADRLHRSQPPLSRQIRLLEDELGVALFARNAQRVTLTEAGQTFLHEIRPVLARIRHAAIAAQRAATGDLGQIIVGVTGSAMFGIVPAILRTFRRTHPGVSVDLRQSPKGEQVNALKQRRLTIGFVRSLTHDDELAHDLLLEEPLVVALSRENELAAQPTLRLSDLAAQGFVLYRGQSSPSVADQIVHFCQQAGFSPRVVQEAEDMQSAAALASLDMGVTLVAASLQQMQLRDLVYRPLSGAGPQPVTRLYAVYRRDDPSPALRAFRRICEEQAAASGGVPTAPEAPAAGSPRSRSRGRAR